MPLRLLHLLRLRFVLLSLWLVHVLLRMLPRLSLGSLCLVSLSLRLLTVLFLSPVSQVLPMMGRKRVIPLDAPGSLMLPIPVTLPGAPLVFEPSVGDPFVVPRVSAPVAVAIVNPPTWIYVIVESWNIAIVRPTSVVMM
jgi:hypothetical protein